MKLFGARRSGDCSPRPARFPLSMFARTRALVDCPACRARVGPLVPARRRSATCLRCGTVFNTRRGYIVRLGDALPPAGDEGTAGVREPLRPAPLGGAGAAALPLPQDG